MAHPSGLSEVALPAGPSGVGHPPILFALVTALAIKLLWFVWIGRESRREAGAHAHAARGLAAGWQAGLWCRRVVQGGWTCNTRPAYAYPASPACPPGRPSGGLLEGVWKVEKSFIVGLLGGLMDYTTAGAATPSSPWLLCSPPMGINSLHNRPRLSAPLK